MCPLIYTHPGDDNPGDLLRPVISTKSGSISFISTWNYSTQMLCSFKLCGPARTSPGAKPCAAGDPVTVTLDGAWSRAAMSSSALFPIAMASNLIAMASNLLVFYSNPSQIRHHPISSGFRINEMNDRRQEMRKVAFPVIFRCAVGHSGCPL